MHPDRRPLRHISSIHHRAALGHNTRERDGRGRVDAQGFVEDGGEVAELGDAGERDVVGGGEGRADFGDEAAVDGGVA